MKQAVPVALVACAISLLAAGSAAASDPLDTWSTNFGAATDVAAAGITTWISGTRVSIDMTNVNSGGKSVRTSGPVGDSHILQPFFALRGLTGSDKIDLSDKTLDVEMFVPGDSPLSWLAIEVTAGDGYIIVKDTIAPQKGRWCSYEVNIAMVLALGSWQKYDWLHSPGISSHGDAVNLLKSAQAIKIDAQADAAVNKEVDAYFLIDSVGWKPSDAIATPEFSASTTAESADGFPRRFHVEGNAFVDQAGQRKVFRGVSMPDAAGLAVMPDPAQPDWNERYFQVMASWGADVVRVPVVPFSLHHIPWDSLTTALDQTIAWAGKNRMYVIIDFHSGGSIAENWYNEDPYNTTNLKEFLDFWGKISLRYAKNDVVAFYELFNEPANPASPPTKAMWVTWKGIAEQAIAVVRANAPEKTILVGGLAWGYDPSFAADAPVADGNVGYVTHPYPKSAFWISKDWDDAFGRLSERCPVFATEIGYQNDKKDFVDITVNGTRYSQAIVDYLEKHDISWTAWCFDNLCYTCLLADKNYTPSQSGDYFRTRLLAAKRSP